LGELKLEAGQVLGPRQVADWLNAGMDAHPSFSSEKTSLKNSINATDVSLAVRNADLLPDEGGVIQLGEDNTADPGNNGLRLARSLE
jgi:hypothetical protein